MVLAPATRSGHVEINAARLHYEERGAGPSLLLIPGGTVDATHYSAVADRLADDFRTVTYDRRANGRSPRPSGWHATSIAEQADDAAGLIESLGLAPCAVWGGSLGGVVLLELLVRRPALVGAALVHEPPLFAVLDDGEQVAKGLLASAAQAIRHGGVREEFRNHVRLSIGEAFEQLPPHLRERMFANATVFFDLEIPALVDHRPEPASIPRVLRRVDVPVTVMGDPHNHAALPFRPPVGLRISWAPNCVSCRAATCRTRPPLRRLRPRSGARSWIDQRLRDGPDGEDREDRRNDE